MPVQLCFTEDKSRLLEVTGILSAPFSGFWSESIFWNRAGNKLRTNTLLSVPLRERRGCLEIKWSISSCAKESKLWHKRIKTKHTSNQHDIAWFTLLGHRAGLWKHSTLPRLFNLMSMPAWKCSQNHINMHFTEDVKRWSSVSDGGRRTIQTIKAAFWTKARHLNTECSEKYTKLGGVVFDLFGATCTNVRGCLLVNWHWKYAQYNWCKHLESKLLIDAS